MWLIYIVLRRTWNWSRRCDPHDVVSNSSTYQSAHISIQRVIEKMIASRTNHKRKHIVDVINKVTHIPRSSVGRNILVVWYPYARIALNMMVSVARSTSLSIADASVTNNESPDGTPHTPHRTQNTARRKKKTLCIEKRTCWQVYSRWKNL